MSESINDAPSRDETVTPGRSQRVDDFTYMSALSRLQRIPAPTPPTLPEQIAAAFQAGAELEAKLRMERESQGA